MRVCIAPEHSLIKAELSLKLIESGLYKLHSSFEKGFNLFCTASKEELMRQYCLDEAEARIYAHSLMWVHRRSKLSSYLALAAQSLIWDDKDASARYLVEELGDKTIQFELPDSMQMKSFMEPLPKLKFFDLSLQEQEQIRTYHKVLKDEADKKELCAQSYAQHEERLERASVIKKLIQSAYNQDDKTIQKLLEHYLGWGQGLTPSFDDALCGALALLCAAQSPAFLRISKILKPELLSSCTNTISASYLNLASAACFSRALSHVLSAYSGALNYKALDELCSLGHSSGRDTLEGVIVAAEELLSIGGYYVNR